MILVIKDTFNSLYKNKNLIFQLCKRDILSRYKGSVIGIAWSVVTPVLMLLLYTFVFSYVFKARWGEGPELPKEMFALVLYTGMILHALISECLNRAPTLMLANANYVKKVVFPLEVLIWIILFSALFQTAIGFLLLIIAKLIITSELSLTIFYLPLILMPFSLFVLGITWIFSAIGVYFKDISHISTILTTVLMFASPIFYSVSLIPENLRIYIYLNPLTYFIEESRNVLIWEIAPNLTHLFFVFVISISVAVFGFIFFQKTRKGFADVL